MSESTGAAENSQKRPPKAGDFQKGKSGNPGGRPKLPEDVKHVRELARQYTEEAVLGLVGAMRSGSGSAKVAAANALLDRGWGKPLQESELKLSGEVTVRRLNVKFD